MYETHRCDDWSPVIEKKKSACPAVDLVHVPELRLFDPVLEDFGGHVVRSELNSLLPISSLVLPSHVRSPRCDHAETESTENGYWIEQQ